MVYKRKQTVFSSRHAGTIGDKDSVLQPSLYTPITPFAPPSQIFSSLFRSTGNEPDKLSNKLTCAKKAHYSAQ